MSGWTAIRQKLEAGAVQTAEAASGSPDASGRGHGSSDAPDGAADRERRIKDLPDRKTAAQSMTADRFEPRRGDAAAVLAIRLSAELTRRDAPFEIRREALRGLREDALLRRLRRLGVHVQHPVQHLHLRIARTELAEVGDH